MLSFSVVSIPYLLIILTSQSQAFTSHRIFINNWPPFSRSFNTGLHGRTNNDEESLSLLDDDVYCKTLTLRDLPSLYRLTLNEFGPLESNNLDKMNLEWKVLSLFTPKLASPNIMGHKVIGLIRRTSQSLVGFIDLSLQPSCGTIAALDNSPLRIRMWIYGKDSLRPYICNLLVAAPFRRRGLGKQLINACETEALNMGYSDVFLHVEESCISALSLYTNHQFAVEKRLSGTGLLFMRKMLVKEEVSINH